MKRTEKSAIAKKEEEILSFWKEKTIFEKTLAKDSPEGEYVFYDGPPFATGLPHYGHILVSTIKDAVPRYKTMRGYHVERKWGWDCHGLPIENIVEKELAISGKKEIESLGIEKFNAYAKGKVLTYAAEWKKTIERIARWVDFDGSYKTMDATYIESVWWAIKELHKKKLLYRGRKVLLYCPRCETPVSKAETAMDNSYQDVTDEAVTVKFKVKNPEKHNLPENTFILAWTTTPWTLPGNRLLAVGEDISYMRATVQKGDTAIAHLKEGETYIFAATPDADERIVGVKAIHPEKGGKRDSQNAEIYVGDTNVGLFSDIHTLNGKDLIGALYEPLYPISGVEGEGVYRVVGGDFVTTDEGTGIVHVAPAYGEDDFDLGTKEEISVEPNLNEKGIFSEDAPTFLSGKYFEDANPLIVDDLEKRDLLFSKKEYRHSYPHCWRCETKLYYSAIDSWFIEMQKAKKGMLAQNKSVTWVPDYLKEGRFKNIVEDAPDWNISRNRYWASPLPIWISEDGEEMKVVGSFEELFKDTEGVLTRLIVVRHGESEKNVQNVIDNSDETYPLTKRGIQEAHDAAKEIADLGADIIYTSPIRRARETAEIIAQEAGLELTIHDGLREVDSGEWNGLSVSERNGREDGKEYAKLSLDDFYHTKRGKTGESWAEHEERIGKTLKDILEKHKGKTIVCVGHQPLIAYGAKYLRDLSFKEALGVFDTLGVKKGTPIVWYVDAKVGKAFDPHRPFIDDVQLTDSRGKEMRRVPEVIDAWVESGSMPFAARHIPFENKEWFDTHFPGHFITEYIAQTRTWFYYTHALATILFGSNAFKNVVTTGTILAHDGQKMSKSKGNFPDPWNMFDAYSVDALRLYLLSSPLLKAEDINFSENVLDEMHKKVLMRLYNILSFYELYRGEDVPASSTSSHVLDRWILSRLSEVVQDVTHEMDIYHLDKATRPLSVFVDDLSTWYVRRSRDRVRGDDKDDKKRALATLRYVLSEFSKVCAPFIPYVAENIFQSVRSAEEEESVHLAAWPMGGPVDKELIDAMHTGRAVVSLLLEEREKAGIKIRQPLAQATIREEVSHDIALILAEEVNVKKVITDKTQEKNVVLDTKLTPELEEEGCARELVRTIQALRKKEGFRPGEQATFEISTNDAGRELLTKKRELIERTTTSKLTTSSSFVEEGVRVACGETLFYISSTG